MCKHERPSQKKHRNTHTNTPPHTHTHTHARTHARTHAHTHTHTQAHKHIRARVCTKTCTERHTHTSTKCVHMCIYICAHMIGSRKKLLLPVLACAAKSGHHLHIEGHLEKFCSLVRAEMLVVLWYEPRLLWPSPFIEHRVWRETHGCRGELHVGEDWRFSIIHAVFRVGLLLRGVEFLTSCVHT